MAALVAVEAGAVADEGEEEASAAAEAVGEAVVAVVLEAAEGEAAPAVDLAAAVAGEVVVDAGEGDDRSPPDATIPNVEL